MRANEIIASTLGMEIGEMNDCAYQPTRHAQVYSVGDSYYCCPQAGKRPPVGWEWKPLNDQFWASRAGRTVYVSADQ